MTISALLQYTLAANGGTFDSRTLDPVHAKGWAVGNSNGVPEQRVNAADTTERIASLAVAVARMPLTSVRHNPVINTR